MELKEIEFNTKSVLIGVAISVISIILAYVILTSVIMEVAQNKMEEVVNRLGENATEAEISEGVREMEAFMFPFGILMYVGFIYILSVPPFITTYTAHYRKPHSVVISSFVVGLAFLVVFSAITGYSLSYNYSNLVIYPITLLLNLPGGLVGHLLAKRRNPAPPKQLI